MLQLGPGLHLVPGIYGVYFFVWAAAVTGPSSSPELEIGQSDWVHQVCGTTLAHGPVVAHQTVLGCMAMEKKNNNGD